MSKPTDGAVKQKPFVHALVPTWGESDPALMVYTGRFPDYALRAIDAWMMANVGADFYRMNVEWGVGTPFVHLECDFRSPATPRDTLLLAVEVADIGRTSLTFRVTCTIAEDDRLCFEGRFVCVCVAGAKQWRPDSKASPLDPRIRLAAETDRARLASARSD